jgi:mannose-6-phosphate isomerase-like protein (cupin superfamily)
VEVWQQAFAPGAGTPIHRHACEEVFIVLAGRGTLFTRADDDDAGASSELHDAVRPRALRFEANSTLVVPHDAVHQVRVLCLHAPTSTQAPLPRKRRGRL